MSDLPNLTEMLTVIDHGARTTEDIFTGPAWPTPHGRAFGGQVLGQALAAAGATVNPHRQLHSMHGYFLRPGDSNKPMTFDVARLHDGRSFCTRRVQVYQSGNVLMSLIASFQSPDAGLEHHLSYDMTTVPAPEELPSVWEKFAKLPAEGRAAWFLKRPFDFRHVDPDITFEATVRSHTERVWMRTREEFTAPRLLQQAALAFASDFLLAEPVVRQHGIPWSTPGLRIASLDHAMWFHRDFQVDDWLLYVLESPTSQGGRGLTHGKFYNRSGQLVASVAQEVMIRVPEAVLQEKEI